MSDNYIPITRVVLGDDVEDLVVSVIRSGNLAQGSLVAQLESQFTDVTGARNAVAVNNGTTALVLALEALGIGPGDEVVTSAFTFVATVNAVLETGAVVRFADIEPDTFCLSLEQAAAECDERTRAVLPVHLYGQSADAAGFAALAASKGLHLVEDSAQAVGATYHGQGVGSFGVGCFSLYATKNVTSAEGGMITTDDDQLADRMRVLRNQGMRARYAYEYAGHNYRLTDLAAAVAIPQMAALTESTRRRRSNAARLIEGLSGIEGLTVPAVRPGRDHVWHQFTVRVAPPAPVGRDELSARLHELGIGSGVYYPRPCYDYDVYRCHPRVRWSPLPEAERAAREVLSLPVHPHLGESDLDRIIDGVRSVMA
mgnify:CR=1 FL=1